MSNYENEGYDEYEASVGGEGAAEWGFKAGTPIKNPLDLFAR
jgi:hypothetical protein